jgi:hypothetical protein
MALGAYLAYVIVSNTIKVGFSYAAGPGPSVTILVDRRALPITTECDVGYCEEALHFS